ncbi:hypothetical protein BSIN_2588 [Burkholderia singularis]|uniref:Uncharacterized protein n=1 Tax=Burkholderia singularis TaxID=1503053 RepID=A0A238H2U4_9BURK|nr:hypothetical protein BSIN_2588 [Burkholderia singularis]
MARWWRLLAVSIRFPAGCANAELFSIAFILPAHAAVVAARGVACMRMRARQRNGR